MEEKLTATTANSFLKEKWGEKETKRKRWNERKKIDKADFLQYKKDFKRCNILWNFQVTRHFQLHQLPFEGEVITPVFTNEEAVGPPVTQDPNKKANGEAWYLDPLGPDTVTSSVACLSLRNILLIPEFLKGVSQNIQNESI